MIVSATYVYLLPNGRWRVERHVRGKRPEVVGYARTRSEAEQIEKRGAK